ncbi:MAG: amino acid adenylation domain-containing protein [Fusobacteriaceae bacterium]|nr:amino acid adenylation domain-containing protein [Fusobacteriaceae bacterium]
MTYLEMKQQIKDKLSTQFDFEDSQNLLEVGLNSLQVVRLVNQWRKQGISVSFGELMENPTALKWWEILQPRIERGKHKEKLNLDAVKSLETINNMPFPLTDVQYAYWIGRNDDQVLGGVGCHAYLEFDGKQVDPIILNKAWNTLQYHHPMLRARFLDNGTQIIMEKPYSEEIYVNDLRNTSEENIDKELDFIRAGLSHRKLKIEEGQVAEVKLTLLPNGLSRVHVDMDLMIADVQSLQILLRDLATAYEGKELPEASKDWSFAGYLKNQTKEEIIEQKNAENYWKKRLDTLPGGPQLPLKKRPEEIKETKFSRRIMRINVKEWEEIKKQSAAYKTTPAMMLLTAYALVLERWSLSKHFLINIPLFNRKTEKKGLEEAIADFTTLLLVEVDCRKKQKFSTLLEKIQKQFYEDMKNSSYSAIQILRDLSQKHKGHYDAAPIVFACNLGIPLTNKSFENHIGKFSYMISQTPQVWLDFQTYESEEGLMLTWDTVDELFPEYMIEDMFNGFENLLRKLVYEDWNQVFDLLPQNQVEFLKNQVNIEPLERPQCLTAAFLEQVKKTPKSIAVIDTEKNVNLTYEVLAEKAKSVAAGIINKGIRNMSIALTLPRGYEQIVAVLGILISGNHYVPVSLVQPKDRRELIHEKTSIHYVITDKRNSCKVDWPATADIWILEELQEENLVKVLPEVSPEDTAYIIMTSGSTGLPKGVEISHCSAWNTIEDINKKYQIHASDTVLCLSAMDFDLSVYDVFGLLGVGGKLVVIPEEERKTPDYWLKVINKYNITIWNSVPVLLEMLLIAIDSSKLKNIPLRIALLSGDWIPMDLPRKLYSLLNNCKLISLGGATEASIWSNYQNVTLPIPEHWKSIPYGRPLFGQAYRVIDEIGRDCPYWVAGELLIGGHGVAKGYQGDSELTNKKFTKENNLRWYHTGDTGRIWPDGTIEFLGRMDYQVKIRGHRIEIGEIEASINQINGIKECLISVLENYNNKKVLIGVVVADSELISESDIKNILKNKVPDYMIPIRILFTDHLLITNNGKRDRKKIVKWIKEQLQENIIKKEPISHEETILLTIWKNLFNNEHLGTDENYFELGGDSLLAIRMIAQVKEKMNYNISLNHIFEYSTINELANKIREIRSENPFVTFIDQKNSINVKADEEITYVLFHEGTGVLTPYSEMVKQLTGAKFNSKMIGFSLDEVEFFLNTPKDKVFEILGIKYANSLLETSSRKFKLIGYCIGGFIALEAAKELKKHGVTVEEVTLIDPNIFVNNKMIEKLEYQELFTDVILEKAFGLLMGADVEKAGFTIGDNHLKEAINQVKIMHEGEFQEENLCKLDGVFVDVADTYKKLLAKTHSERLIDILKTISTLTESEKNVFFNMYNLFKYSFEAMCCYQIRYEGKIRILICQEQTKGLLINTYDEFSPTEETLKKYLSSDIYYSIIGGDHFSCMKNPQMKDNLPKIIEELKEK